MSGGSNARIMHLTNISSHPFREDYGGRLLYEIYEQTKTWAEIFEVMEVIKKKFPLENYTLSQTTLEQVFLTFAELQREK